MAIDPSISLNAKTPNPLDSYKNLLEVGNLANAYQQGKINLNIANQTQDAAIAQKNAESQVSVGTAPERVAQAQTQTQQNKYDLNQQQMKLSQQLISGLMNDKRILSNDSEQQKTALLEAEGRLKEAGIPDSKLRGMMAPFYMVADHADPSQGNHIVNMLQTANNQLLSPEAQAAYNRVPVSQREQVSSSPTGSMIVTGTNDAGQKFVKQLPSTGPQVNFGIGELESIKPMTDIRNAMNSAAAKAPEQHFNNQQIIKILNNPDFINQSGAGASTLAKYLGSIGAPVGETYAANTQSLAHYLALQTQANESVMGVETDSGRNTAKLATGSIDMTPKALLSATKVNDAAVSGLEHFNQGAEQAIKNNNNNVLALRDFRNKWSKVYSPEAMIAYNAYKNNDTQELAELTKSLGGSNSPKFKEMIEKMQAMEKLTKTGDL